MSTATKRLWAQAMADAEAFRQLFPNNTYEKWEFGGSLRRRKPEVADVEHIVIPCMGDVATTGGLFSEPKTVNLLWHRLDELVAKGTVAKHVYGTTPTGAPLYRYGEKYRGIDFWGHMHELFATTADAWGAIFLIRTGPAEYSERVVTALKQGGIYRQQEGKLVQVATGEAVPVPDEQTYCRMAGLRYLEPEARR